MLFLSIFTYDAADREKVVKRHVLGGERAPEGVQVLQEVVDLQRNRVFRIAEVTDPKAILAANMAWGDLGNIETFPVMETEEMLEALHRIDQKDHHRERPVRPIPFYLRPQM
jgi:uncharacterized FAD-dependent dehydrogenase